MGDSMVVINWMKLKGLFKMGSLVLSPIYDQLKLMEKSLNNLLPTYL